MGPECEKVSEGGGVNFMLELLKKDCYKFATNSGFNGGTSNRRVPDEGTQKHTKEFRCFHKFLVRYLDYNMNAYENFVDILSKRLLESVSDACVPPSTRGVAFRSAFTDCACRSRLMIRK